MTTHLEWRRLAQLGPFHWHDIEPRRAARVALGVVVPLGLGWATGHVDYGAYAALGALPAGTASFQGETRSRVAVVVAASVGMAVSTFVGATTAAAAPWLLVPVVALWGYFTGLGVALGPRFGTAALQWSIALLIAVALPLDVVGAALRAGLVLAGGLLQAALVAASWTLRRNVELNPSSLTGSESLLQCAASASVSADAVAPRSRPVIRIGRRGETRLGFPSSHRPSRPLRQSQWHGEAAACRPKMPAARYLAPMPPTLGEQCARVFRVLAVHRSGSR